MQRVFLPNLGASIDKLKTKYHELDSIMQKRQAVMTQRANLRGQIMDTVALGVAMAAPIKAAVDFESAIERVPDPDYRDAINHISNNIAAKAKEIIPALNRAGGSVRQFGLEADQAAALVATLRSISESVANFAKEHPILTKGIVGLTTALVGAKVAGLALGYAWTFIKGGILAVMTVWKTVSLAFATNPVGVVVAALAGAALLIITNWEKVKEFFSTIWAKLRLDAFFERLTEAVRKFWGTISAPFKAIGKAWNWITGGETKYGISKRWYPNLDIRNLTVDGAKLIYYRDFWEPQLYGDFESVELAEKVFDLAVNVGTNKSIVTKNASQNKFINGWLKRAYT
ncbi:MAG: phage tail tape measure protein [Holosporales bacterium]|nr:phage tail tape measure protein [Holosporales bacterium]